MIVVTFVSVNYSMLSEKYLKDAGVKTMMIPSPREITKSCGLSIMINPDQLEEVKKVLIENEVEVSGIFKVEDGKAELIWNMEE